MGLERLATVRSIMERCLARDPDARWPLRSLVVAVEELRVHETAEGAVSALQNTAPSPTSGPPLPQVNAPAPPVLLGWDAPPGLPFQPIKARIRFFAPTVSILVYGIVSHPAPVSWMLLSRDDTVTRIPPASGSIEHLDHDVVDLMPGQVYQFRSAGEAPNGIASALSTVTHVCIHNDVPMAPAVVRDTGLTVVVRLHNPFHAAQPPPKFVLVMVESERALGSVPVGSLTEETIEAGAGTHPEFTSVFPSLQARAGPCKLWMMYKFILPQGAWHSASSPAVVLPPQPRAPRLVRWDITGSGECAVVLALDNPWATAVPCSTSVELEINGVLGSPIPVQPGQVVVHHVIADLVPGLMHLLRSRCHVEQGPTVLLWSEESRVVLPRRPSRPVATSVSSNSVGLDLQNTWSEVQEGTSTTGSPAAVVVLLQVWSDGQRDDDAPILRIPLAAGDSGSVVPYLATGLRGECTQCFRSSVSVALSDGDGESMSEWSKVAKVPLLPKAPVLGGWSLNGGVGTATILVDNAWAPLDKRSLWSVEVHVSDCNGEPLGSWVVTEAAPRVPLEVVGRPVGVLFKAWSRFRRQQWDEGNFLASAVAELVLPVAPGLPKSIVVKDSVIRSVNACLLCEGSNAVDHAMDICYAPISLPHQVFLGQSCEWPSSGGQQDRAALRGS
jgi:hypothetical protein